MAAPKKVELDNVLQGARRPRKEAVIKETPSKEPVLKEAAPEEAMQEGQV